jgi:hypothetical protein
MQWSNKWRNVLIDGVADFISLHSLKLAFMAVWNNCFLASVLTELGRFPMYIDVLKQMFMYWHRLEHSPSNLLNRAFSEYKNNTNQDSNSWYSNLLL